MPISVSYPLTLWPTSTRAETHYAFGPGGPAAGAVIAIVVVVP